MTTREQRRVEMGVRPIESDNQSHTPTPQSFGDLMRDTVPYQAGYAQGKLERDALVAALRDLIQQIESTGPHHSQFYVLNEARAALAAVDKE